MNRFLFYAGLILVTILGAWTPIFIFYMANFIGGCHS